MAERADIETGSRWLDCRGSFAKGARREAVRVMAVADGWVMVRFPHAMPFCMAAKDFVQKFECIPVRRPSGGGDD